VPYTDFTVDSDRWGSSGSSNWYALSPSTKLSLSWDNYLLGNNDNSATSNFIGIFTPVFTQRVVSGREITLSFLGAYPDAVETFNRIALRNMNTGGYQWFSAPGSTIMDYTPIDQTIQTDSKTGSKFSHGLYTLTVTPNFSGKARFLIGGHISGDPTDAWIRINNVKVEKASNASAYTPSSNDANERWSQIKQTTDSITSEVGKKVGNDEIISRINQSAEKISINANKINISGASINISSNPAIKKLEKEEVGGANLLRGTTVDKDNLKYLVSVNGGTSNVDPTVSTLDGVPYFLVREVTGGTSSSYISVRTNGDNSTLHIRKGQTYVLSFVARKSLYTDDFRYTYLMRPNAE